MIFTLIETKESRNFRHTSFKESMIFFRRWLRNPARLGAVLPSSKSLSMAMANHVMTKQQQKSGQYVVEIGAGTGRFTEALVEMGFPQEKIICVEIEKDLYEYMKKRFPDMLIVWGNAEHLDHIIPKSIHHNISCVVSGIPMVSIPPEVQKNIVESCFKIMGPEGCVFQFTYSLFSPITQKGLKVKGQRINRTFWNIPPASIWSYKSTV